jgi:hypothetical protein
VDKAIKALLAALGLVALATALCFVSGFATQLFLGDELEQSAQQAAKAANLIFERTQLKSQVNFSLKKSFTSGLTISEVEVRFERIPPDANREALFIAAEAAVRECFPNLGSFTVAGIPNPRAGPPGLRRPPPATKPEPAPSVNAGAAAPVAAVEPKSVEKEKEKEKPAKKSAAGRGQLTLFTIPAGAAVSLNGKALGKTPLLKVPVPVGTQLFKVTFPDGRRKQLSAKIEADQLSRFKFNQDELPDG